jgi:uncharacterized protein (DUF2267 family)
LERHVDPAEAAQVKHMLPKAVRQLWPSETRPS